MALDVTIGGAATDSYNSVVEFEAYIAGRLHVPASVLAMTSPQKEAALRLATTWIDKVCYLGAAATITQFRKFPRTGLLTQTGADLPADIHPREIKDATNELAFLMFQSDLTVESVGPLQGLTDLKAGPVSLSFKSDTLKLFRVIPDSVKLLLPQEWICLGDRVIVVPDTGDDLVFEMI